MITVVTCVYGAESAMPGMILVQHERETRWLRVFLYALIGTTPPPRRYYFVVEKVLNNNQLLVKKTYKL